MDAARNDNGENSRPQSRGPARVLVRRVMLTVGSTLLALLACEGLLRAIGYSYTPLHIVNAYAARNDRRQYHSFEDKHFRSDPLAFWRPREGYPPFNAQGFRGEELPREKGPDEFRIFALGDSNTLGWQDGPDGPGSHWPRFIRELLPASGRKYTVINAGVWGYSSYQGRERLRHVLPYKPDLVLISFGGNDPHRVLISDIEQARQRPSSLWMQARMSQMTWAIWERCSLARRPSSDEDLVFRVDLEHYRANLGEMVCEVRRTGAACVLLTRPFLGTSADPACWKTYGPQYVTATLETAQTNHVPAIDLYARFKDQRQYFADDGHFNEEGHRLAAKVIYDEIRPLLPR